MESLTTQLLYVPTLKVEIFMNLLNFLSWYLLVEGEIMAIGEDMVVEDALNAFILKE